MADRPDSLDHVNQLVLFCQRPENKDHPYADQWVAQMTKCPPGIQSLEPNVLPYRSVTKSRSYYRKAASKQYTSETVLEVGPIGSADPSAKRAGEMNLVDKARREKAAKTSTGQGKGYAGDEGEEGRGQAAEEEESPLWAAPSQSKRKQRRQGVIGPEDYEDLEESTGDIEQDGIGPSKPPLRRISRQPALQHTLTPRQKRKSSATTSPVAGPAAPATEEQPPPKKRGRPRKSGATTAAATPALGRKSKTTEEPAAEEEEEEEEGEEPMEVSSVAGNVRRSS